MIAQKPDSAEICSIIQALTARPWLDSGRSRWPLYLFHVTDVHNAVSILQQGQLLCRESATAAGIMYSDNASASVIDSTDAEVHRLARLYFRPRTPTFANNEGIRPLGQRQMESHCPMPIAFLFDSQAVLSLRDSQFSNGSLARRGSERRAQRGSTADFFRSLPFDKIYHDRSLYGYTGEEKDEIIFRRQAEVFVPERLPIDEYLRHVYARTPAEFETLLALLNAGERAVPQHRLARIRTNTQLPLFFRQWSFVERVAVDAERVVVRMNPSSKTPGPFHAVVEFVNPETGEVIARPEQRDFMSKSWQMAIPKPFVHGRFVFRFMLDGCLAYQSSLDSGRDTSLLVDAPSSG